MASMCWTLVSVVVTSWLQTSLELAVTLLVWTQLSLDLVATSRFQMQL